jgi:hypothetical protein
MQTKQAIAALLSNLSLAASMDSIESAERLHKWLFVGYVVVLVLTALFTFLVWDSGNRAQKAIRAEADARIAAFKSESDAAKRESDEKIAALNKQAELLRLEAETARKDISAGKAEAAKANERAGLANERAALANKAAEEIRADNLALQRIMQPRVLYTNCDGADKLPEFRGTIAIIFVIPSDFEAFMFANSIAGVLANSGWKPEIRFVIQIFDGVSVYGGEFPDTGDTTHFESKENTWRAAHALARCLTNNFIATETGSNVPVSHHDDRILPASTTTFARPSGSVAVTVGMKPTRDNLLMLKHMKSTFSNKTPGKP